jgi:hypothetical protein
VCSASLQQTSLSLSLYLSISISLYLYLYLSLSLSLSLQVCLCATCMWTSSVTDDNTTAWATMAVSYDEQRHKVEIGRNPSIGCKLATATDLGSSDAESVKTVLVKSVAALLSACGEQPIDESIASMSWLVLYLHRHGSDAGGAGDGLVVGNNTRQYSRLAVCIDQQGQDLTCQYRGRHSARGSERAPAGSPSRARIQQTRRDCIKSVASESCWASVCTYRHAHPRWGVGHDPDPSGDLV